MNKMKTEWKKFRGKKCVKRDVIKAVKLTERELETLTRFCKGMSREEATWKILVLVG